MWDLSQLEEVAKICRTYRPRLFNKKENSNWESDPDLIGTNEGREK